jgi:hypothetical protein
MTGGEILSWRGERSARPFLIPRRFQELVEASIKDECIRYYLPLNNQYELRIVFHASWCKVAQPKEIPHNSSDPFPVDKRGAMRGFYANAALIHHAVAWLLPYRSGTTPYQHVFLDFQPGSQAWISKLKVRP